MPVHSVHEGLENTKNIPGEGDTLLEGMEVDRNSMVSVSWAGKGDHDEWWEQQLELQLALVRPVWWPQLEGDSSAWTWQALESL